MPRSSRQCREHWICKLDPELESDAFSAQEDANLLQCVARLGYGNWQRVLRELTQMPLGPGEKPRTRNEVQIKNRINQQLKRVENLSCSMHEKICFLLAPQS